MCVTFKSVVSFTINFIFIFYLYLCFFCCLKSVREWSYVTVSARQRNAACNYSLSINLFYLYIYIFIVSYRIETVRSLCSSHVWRTTYIITVTYRTNRNRNRNRNPNTCVCTHCICTTVKAPNFVCLWISNKTKT